ncbi:MAG: ABC transporter ATP-binding protein [Anaerolineae bacterium]|jgi:energy-coupling factor transport system ATP-binding protein|nr:ABC transporter ATP-binding protein [Anaerolineae bacterium]MBT3713926.1 ABC transporter ATP-binding protein [Anaerolineae bacterium]MBT4311787.1 ABC transporter ATP-binding protein [Anaerolineae bacterium]MBT4458937.1 ABC transporter ATP-binding protein [Anaerolineae bacterium]MBT4842484.1 ABC transporter ATP-binding protein [Anaerolineae bacterium]
MTNSVDALPLEITNLNFTYRIRTTPAINNINLSIKSGELMLVAGASGSGKTTLMRCINGLIPRSYRGVLEGEIKLFGTPITEMEMSDLSQQVGTLLQDPERQIVSSHVMNEVAFGLENLAWERERIIERVDETLDFLNISFLRDRETFTLSGGERQKVALAGILAMHPKVLILDEPLASLDPASAREALELFRRLADDGISIMLVEHRVDEVLGIKPDSVFYLDEGREIYSGNPAGLMDTADYHRIKLPAKVILERAKKDEPISFDPVIKKLSKIKQEDKLLEFKDVTFSYDSSLPDVLHNISFDINKGDVIAVLGHNGAGKSTLVKHALGLLKPTEGDVLLQGLSSKEDTVAHAAETVGYVFQSPGHMLFAPTVEEELSFGPENLKFAEEIIKENVDWAIKTVNLEEYADSPPLALSYGQQKRVSIAAILSMRSRVLVMDEPTAGQDYWNYRSFMDSILEMPGFDSIVFITHDVDLAVVYANRILLLSDGKVMADGSPQEVLGDEEALKACRVLPTSLLEINQERFSQTGRFMRAEELAHVL